ncbi:hypothetical protein ABES02_29150 [Neobacillus pocheonensis]|uniref:hypothetical protein n=1 Tax=Neobacillus pocheonensis TaxID=363869 RepID=UPI003D2DB58F
MSSKQEEKLLLRRINDLRIHLKQMEKGKRILLRDGRIGFFQGYSGNEEMFDFDFKGVIQSIYINEYESVLIDDPAVKCPICNSRLIMDGYLSGTDCVRVKFFENISNDNWIAPDINRRSIKTCACYECGYVMNFVEVKPLVTSKDTME